MRNRTETFPESASRRKRPTFFWQGALILLPVAVLTGLGALSIREDRRLALIEAQDQSGVALRWLTNRIAQLLPTKLRETEDGRWPRYELSSDQRVDFDPVIRFDGRGRLLEPRAYPATPHPPRWFRELSPSQRAAWETARTGRLQKVTPERGTDAFDAFLTTGPSEEASLNARFERLRAETRAAGAAPDFVALLGFAETNLQVLSPAGIPLHALALGDTLRQAGPEIAIEETLPQAFTVQVDECPSFLTERLLLEAIESSGPEPELDRLLSRWGADQVLRQLSAEITPSERVAASPVARWLGVTNVFWLALMGPEFRQEEPDEMAAATAERATRVRLVAKRDLDEAFNQTLFSEENEWPAYGEVTVEIEGMPLELVASVRPPANDDPTPLLAEVSGAIDRLPPWRSIESAGDTVRVTGRSDALPASLNYRLRLHLASPDVLYARHRRRTFFFGALIAVAAATAGIGCFSAHRAFHRQLRLNEMKSNFVSSVSHELRAPIASVRLLAESLDRGKVSGEAKRKEYFRLIVQECQRLSALIMNVLDFSRIDQGRRRYDFESVDLVALFEQTVGIMAPYASERGVRLNLRSPRKGGATEVDDVRPLVDGKALQQALVNLIDNAIKHSAAGEEVSVGMELREMSAAGSLRFWVEDQGPGIPPEDRRRIFEPFFRRGSELRRETTGAGIGLNIVRHVVEAHRGRVWVESRSGKGSRFVIEIPVRSEVAK